MRRREFITVVGCVTATWPLRVRAQQSEPMRSIAVLSGIAGDDPELRERMAAFRQELQKLGWADGRNMRIDFREGAVDAARYRKLAEELAALGPDVILTTGGYSTMVMMQATSTIPIVFTSAACGCSLWNISRAYVRVVLGRRALLAAIASMSSITTHQDDVGG